jgi:hypothetical protein
MTRCPNCKKPMVQVYSSYAPRAGRCVQTEVQYECKNGCLTRVTITDPQLPTMSRTTELRR